MCSAFMEWAGLDSLKSVPQKIKVLKPSSSEEEKRQYLNDVIGAFVDEYIMVECDVDKEIRTQHEQAAKQKRTTTEVPIQQPVAHHQEPQVLKTMQKI